MKKTPFGHERAGVTAYWKELQIAKQHDLYCFANITKIIKSRNIWWAGHVARMAGEKFIQVFGGEI